MRRQARNVKIFFAGGVSSSSFYSDSFGFPILSRDKVLGQIATKFEWAKNPNYRGMIRDRFLSSQRAILVMTHTNINFRYESIWTLHPDQIFSSARRAGSCLTLTT
jgi:hypothetical protein